MITLPKGDDLFLKYFDPWYTDAGRKRRPFKGTFPDIMQNPALIGCSQMDVSRVNVEMQEKVLDQITKMVEAARGDMPDYLKLDGDIDLRWIDAFDRYADRARIKDLIQHSDPKKFTNYYLVTCCEFGAALSHVLRASQPRLVWRLDFPYWDSSLFDPRTGTVITVFHWAIKKMSEYGVEDGYAAKVKACLQLLEEERKL
jgi:hypothetical protein